MKYRMVSTGAKVAIGVGAVVALAATAGYLLTRTPIARTLPPPTQCPSGDVPANSDGSCPTGYIPDPDASGCCMTETSPTGSTLAVELSGPLFVPSPGTAETYAVAASGGTPPYTYSWYVENSSGTVIQQGVAENLSVTFPADGTYAVVCSVTDATGNVLGKSLSVLVGPLPGSTFDATINGVPGSQSETVASGSVVSLTAGAIGGTPPYTFQWIGVPSGWSQSGNTVTSPPLEPGSYVIGLGVSDSAGTSSASAELIIYVTAPVLVPTISVSPTVLPNGGTVTILVGNGVPGYSVLVYRVYSGNVGVIGGGNFDSNGEFSITFPLPYDGFTYSVGIYAKNAPENTVSPTVTVTVG